MRLLHLFLTALLFVGFVAGCTTAPTKERNVEAAPAPVIPKVKVVALPFETPPPPVDQLSPEIIFNVLSGEVALQRGQLRRAYQYQLQAAELSGDPRAAERAARLAMLLRDRQLALEAANRWVELAPNDLSARQLAAALLFKEGDLDGVFVQLQAIVSISEATGEDGFLHAMTALSREKRVGDAVGLMQRLASEHPDDPRGLYAVAMTAVLGKDHEEALRHARALVRRYPEWVRGYLLLSRIHIAQGDKSAARELLEEAIKRYPDKPLLRMAYARMLLDAEELKRAYEQFRYLQRLTPEDADVHYFLGVLALELGHYAEAKEHLLRLRKTGERLEKAAYYLGRVAELQEAPAEAIRWYRKVRRGTLAYEAQVRSARLMAGQGDLAVAQDWLQALRIRMPKRSVELYLVEVELLREHGTAEQVMALFDKALRAHPADPDLLYGRALYAVTLGRLDILERDLRRVIADNPQHADALNALGYTLADQTDRFQEALGFISRALALKPDAPAILDSMGWVHYRLGHYDKAVVFLQRAMRLLPDAEIAAHYGEVLWVTGRQEQARKVWEGALAREPGSEHVLEVMRRLGQK